jgi:hypothetical protein
LVVVIVAHGNQFSLLLSPLIPWARKVALY